MFAASKVAGAAAAGSANYIEDVFSTYLYTGNGSTQTITNNIDLSTKGGLVWIKSRNARTHVLFDTARGTSAIESNTTNAQSSSRGLTAYTTSGFSLNDPVAGDTNATSVPFASWTFRKQPKFFDVVTYTGTGSATTIAHNLGSVPGCIIIKRTSGVELWAVYHRGLTSAGNALALNTTDAQYSAPAYFNSTAPTSSVFSVGTATSTNASGSTYVAYIFAHNSGGFGLTGTDNVISCGSWTASSTAPVNVTLGYEPQFVLTKRATGGTQGWNIYDVMRGMPVGGSDAYLQPNTSAAEGLDANYIEPTATGFTIPTNAMGNNGDTFIYVAIRRGPMKTPTSGTSVFLPSAYTGTSSNATRTVGFPPDSFFSGIRSDQSGLGLGGFAFIDKLRGWGSATGLNSYLLGTYSTAVEQTRAAIVTSIPSNNSLGLGSDNSGTPFAYSFNFLDSQYVEYFFRRAPGFFDEVCYTGNGTAGRSVNHNLGVAPEFMFVKQRNAVRGFVVWSSGIPITSRLYLNSNSAKGNSSVWGSTLPTSTVFTVTEGGTSETNASGGNYVAYLFATCAGVSKVGSYTGTGATQTIDCGFTGGARFVLIKRTDSTGEWYVWDTARGMVAGTDPKLALNSTAAETNANWVYTASTGFQIVTSDANVNASGGSYIYLAIA